MIWYYTKQGYALIQNDSATEDHWFGGDPYHKGAECPSCHIPLLLIADLSCAPFRLLEEARIFHEWNRIPLYYCWRCADDISYRFTKRGKIKVFDRDGCPQGDDFPYRGFPLQFSRKPVSVVPIPYELAKLLAISQEIDDDEDWLSDDDRNLIAKELALFRHDGFGEEMRHQIGGLVKCVQGHEHLRCPNKKCECHKLFKDSKSFHMKELAVIHNDPRSGLPMIESLEEFERTSRFDDWVQIVYWICDECLAITATNRCD